ncbi:MAG: pyridoxal 5'-phosphate synthase glutaminase subunit PdxT [Candidatus Kapaibacterium sp.]
MDYKTTPLPPPSLGGGVVVGVLGLQGDFREHIQKLESLGAGTRDVRRTSDLEGIDALIIPGGESTAVAILEKSEAAKNIFEEIRLLGEEGLPIWGTCMGSILLAKDIEGSRQGRLGLMDITVHRNAFGPQRFSSEMQLHIPALGEADFPGVFIRAPIITNAGKNVEVLGKLDQGIVMAREGNFLATVFHPEVVDDSRVHEYFLKMI